MAPDYVHAARSPTGLHRDGCAGDEAFQMFRQDTNSAGVLSCFSGDPYTFFNRLRPVEPPILNRLRYLGSLQRLCTCEIRDRARDLENAVIRTRRQSQPADRLLEQSRARLVRHAVLVDLARRQARVGLALTCKLALARSGDARAHRFARFA